MAEPSVRLHSSISCFTIGGMVRVLVFGVFDLLHEGHRYFLEKAREYGDYVVASVARDSFVSRYKDRLPVHNQESRIDALLKSGLVNEAVLSDEKTGNFEVIKTVSPQCICLGYDQEKLGNAVKDWLKSESLDIKTVILPPFREDRFKTSFLIEKGI